MLVPAVIAAGVVAVALGAWADLWFLPFAAGLATGAVTAWHRTGRLRTTALLVLFGRCPGLRRSPCGPWPATRSAGPRAPPRASPRCPPRRP
ncbi:hypothetical protein [Streptomyces sp. KL116D]|uniref:hypothetical protein n=1 Tax=Streptomyces sp. KL116D TaxID=3045152 RepID=UPI003556DA62